MGFAVTVLVLQRAGTVQIFDGARCNEPDIDGRADRGAFFHQGAVGNIITSPVDEVPRVEFDSVEIIMQDSEFQVIGIIECQDAYVLVFLIGGWEEILTIVFGEFPCQEKDARRGGIYLFQVFPNDVSGEFVFLLNNGINTAFRIKQLHICQEGAVSEKSVWVPLTHVNGDMMVPVIEKVAGGKFAAQNVVRSDRNIRIGFCRKRNDIDVGVDFSHLRDELIIWDGDHDRCVAFADLQEEFPSVYLMIRSNAGIIEFLHFLHQDFTIMSQVGMVGKIKENASIHLLGVCKITELLQGINDSGARLLPHVWIVIDDPVDGHGADSQIPGQFPKIQFSASA